jgi:hypothetical protein
MWQRYVLRIASSVGILLALLLAPSAVWAHAGHSHTPKASVSVAVDQPAAAAVTKSAAAVAELTSAPAIPNAPDSVDVTCCGTGAHCTACCGLVVPLVLAVVPPILHSSHSLEDWQLLADLDPDRLQRPPRSFV